MFAFDPENISVTMKGLFRPKSTGYQKLASAEGPYRSYLGLARSRVFVLINLLFLIANLVFYSKFTPWEHLKGLRCPNVPCCKASQTLVACRTDEEF